MSENIKGGPDERASIEPWEGRGEGRTKGNGRGDKEATESAKDAIMLIDDIDQSYTISSLDEQKMKLVVRRIRKRRRGSSNRRSRLPPSASGKGGSASESDRALRSCLILMSKADWATMNLL